MTPRFTDGYSLYTGTGARKYLNGAERQRALDAADALPPKQALFVLSLAHSGGRLSEILALTPAAFQLDAGIVAIRTLKRRGHHVREVPLPQRLITALDEAFDLRTAQGDPTQVNRRLWPWSRTTAWRLVKRVMRAAGLVGLAACPKGLRHAFGVVTLGIVPANIRQKWMGHARPETTDIYSAVCGPEEIAFAMKFWNPATT